MYKYSEARKKLLEVLHSRSVGGQDGVVILDEERIEKPYGWVLFYNSRRYIETGDMTYALMGNGPVIILFETEEVVELGSALPDEVAIAAFERVRELSPEGPSRS